MANVNIKFNGKEFLLSCDDGQEEHLEELLTHINEKFSSLDCRGLLENPLARHSVQSHALCNRRADESPRYAYHLTAA